MPKVGRPHPLDRPVARLVAVAVALTAAGALAAVHRDELGVLLAGPAAMPARCATHASSTRASPSRPGCG